jgi:hypothetical protein
LAQPEVIEEVSRWRGGLRNWQLLAACQPVGPELFFLVSSAGKSLQQVAEAKAVCARCLIRRQCLAFALRTAPAANG